MRYLGIALIVVFASLLVALLGASYASLSHSHALLEAEIEGREKAEAALRQSQKMEAMGQLTGGVAHDFNRGTHAQHRTVVIERMLEYPTGPAATFASEVASQPLKSCDGAVDVIELTAMWPRS